MGAHEGPEKPTKARASPHLLLQDAHALKHLGIGQGLEVHLCMATGYRTKEHEWAWAGGCGNG